MQFLMFYPIIMGYSFSQVLTSSAYLVVVAYGVFILFVNGGYAYGAQHFRSMAYHALNREAALADRLDMQRPHPMIWGYRAGQVTFGVSSVFAIVLLTVRILQLAGRLPS